MYFFEPRKFSHLSVPLKNLAFDSLSEGVLWTTPSPFSKREGHKEFLDMPLKYCRIWVKFYFKKNLLKPSLHLPQLSK